MASAAIIKVRFPDGVIRYGTWDGTADFPYPRLFDSPEGCCDRPRGKEYWQFPEPSGDPEPVEIACDYGGGFYWSGTALTDRLVDDGMTPPAFMDDPRLRESVRGYPSWWHDDLGERAVEPAAPAEEAATSGPDRGEVTGG